MAPMHEKLFGPTFLCVFVTLYMVCIPRGKMYVIAQAVHYITFILLYTYDDTDDMRTAITVSTVLQFILDILTAIAYIVYVTNTDDTSVLYYYDFIRTMAIIIICICDVLVYIPIISHLYCAENEKHIYLHFGKTDKPNKTFTIILTAGIWVLQIVSLILTILALYG